MPESRELFPGLVAPSLTILNPQFLVFKYVIQSSILSSKFFISSKPFYPTSSSALAVAGKCLQPGKFMISCCT